jgi:hypothetical protein
LPQACDDPTHVARLTGARIPSLKGDDESAAAGVPGRRSHECVDGDVFPALTLLAYLGHRERLHHPLSAWTESNGGVLVDDGAIEGPRRFEEPEQRLFFGSCGTRG